MFGLLGKEAHAQTAVPFFPSGEAQCQRLFRSLTPSSEIRTTEESLYPPLSEISVQFLIN
jgi:hypothetical protein